MQKEERICKTAVAYGQSKGIGSYALAAAANELKVAGVSQAYASVRIMIPEYAFKSRIHTMEKGIRRDCKREGIVLTELTSYQTAAVNTSLVVVSGTGKVKNLNKEEQLSVKPGMDILLTKWVGMEGMLRIIEEREAELKTRFTPLFLNQCKQFKERIFDCREIEAAEQEGVSMIRQITEGGIFAALWEIARDFKVGLHVEMNQISIRQETIEVCEYFRLNPYQLTSAGSFLLITPKAEQLLQNLEDQEIEACVIGKITDNKDKIIRNGGEIRYIDRSVPDELNKIISGRSLE